MSLNRLFGTFFAGAVMALVLSLFSGRAHARPSMPDFSSKEWERTLAEMDALDFDRVMYAHNVAVGPRSSVAEQLKYLRDLRAAVLAELKRGTPFMQVPTTVKLPHYATGDGYDEWLPMNTWRILLEIAMVCNDGSKASSRTAA